MIELFYLAVVILSFFIASYTDIRRHEVPRSISYSLVIGGIAGHAVWSYFSGSFSPIVQSVAFAAICFVFAYALYRAGVWAGGDVKLFAGLGAMLPSFGAVSFFPFVSLVLSLAAVFPFIIFYTAYYLLVQPSFMKDFKPLARKAAINALQGAVLLTVFYILLSIQMDYVTYLATSLALSAVIFFAMASYSLAKKSVLREKKAVSKLSEGDILAKDLVKVKGKYSFSESSWKSLTDKSVILSALNAGGLEKKDIALLRKAGIKSVELKKSLPFVPIFTLGIILAFALEMLLY